MFKPKRTTCIKNMYRDDLLDGSPGWIILKKGDNLDTDIHFYKRVSSQVTLFEKKTLQIV